MGKVALVTDSTATIPVELSQGLSISVVPLQVIWGSDTYRDSIDIQPTEFYQRLKNSKVTPSTSQPSPAAFAETYTRLLDEGYEILSVHISSKLSGTVDSAIQARQDFPGASIELVDSQTTSMGMGYPIVTAARAAAHGASLQECKALVEKGCANSGLFFAVSTLEYLHRGGRIGGAAAFLGTALNLKPILELRNGRIEAVERVRTMNKAIDRLLDVYSQKIGNRRPLQITGLHANAPEEARLLLERALQRFNVSEVSESVLAEVSPVLGTHTGPGTIGLAFTAGL
ncbi:MAG: DegV family protein [Chloroflexi bacterium]|nr:MAG: DegV family protein [Chloroflexota bacterium]